MEISEIVFMNSILLISGRSKQNTIVLLSKRNRMTCLANERISLKKLTSELIKLGHDEYKSKRLEINTLNPFIRL